MNVGLLAMACIFLAIGALASTVGFLQLRRRMDDFEERWKAQMRATLEWRMTIAEALDRFQADLDQSKLP